MRRREFIALCGAAIAWPVAARAQPPGKIPTIGYLSPTKASVSAERISAFVQRLSELGWIEGQTIAIVYRWAEGNIERSRDFAAEFVQLKVDAIVTSGVPGIIAAKQATSVIPIVFAVAADPVGSGLVASLARPGGNVTGLSNQSGDIAGKRLELFREVVPGLRRLAIVANVGSPDRNPDPVLEMRELQTAVAKLGLDAVTLEVREPGDIARAIEGLKGRAELLYVVADPLLNSNNAQIQTLTMKARLPTVYNASDFVKAGGLMSYGPNFPDLFRRAAEFVDKILRGAKPADIPVEQPTKFDLVINLKTAKAFGLNVPPTLLATADEVIE
jgi:putative ABC transport system substrate-binding protein